MRGNAVKRRSRESGSQVVEATFVIVPLLLMTFLMLDLSMVIFVRTTLQEAVREGTRYAITGQNAIGPCQDDSVKWVVKKYALGFLNTTAGASSIHVQFVNPTTGGQGTNARDNIVNVKIEGYQYKVLAPFENFNSSIYVFAEASDLMEPISGASPCLTKSTDQ